MRRDDAGTPDAPRIDLAPAVARVLEVTEDAPALDRAEGLRYVHRLGTLGHDLFVEHADPDHPTLFEHMHATRKFGLDSPDNRYLMATIGGDRTYRVRGDRGEAPYIGFGVNAGHYGDPSGQRAVNHLNGDDLAVGPDGTFELLIGPPDARAAHDGDVPWLVTEPDASSLLVRQTFDDRAVQRPAELDIEVVDGAASPPAPTLEAVTAGLARAGRFVDGCVDTFIGLHESWMQAPNTLVDFSRDIAGRLHGDPDIDYLPGAWSLADDQVLLIEFAEPRCQYWGFQVANRWLESLDARHHPVAVNHRSVVREPDGSVRLVIGERRPAWATNWMTTAGHRTGTMMLRFILAEPFASPAVQVVKVADGSRSQP